MKTVKIKNFTFLVPDKTSEINVVKKSLATVNKKVGVSFKMTDELHERLYKEIINVLCTAADISIPFIQISDQVNQLLLSIKGTDRELLDFKYSLHEEIDSIKGRCYYLIESIDKKYQWYNKRNPKEYII